LRAISKAQAGQKWPAGPALAAPELADGNGGIESLKIDFQEMLANAKYGTQ
jgi:hypothetical protein